ncbi:unnamed protein product [Peronospora destructor]|uniref:Uncharacterized protein n=1 Tax=Peronospora destructor TaxID=86335 RepID=A0AAV0VDN2_9STRA|nr:unnamed protein product [Peronospora destructor]
MRVALSLLALPAVAATRSVADTLPGGWVLDKMSSENIDKLTFTLRRDSSDPMSSSRVCWSKVDSIFAQVVSGTNYLYNIRGCSTTHLEGLCSDHTLKSCTLAHFQVHIFQQEWTNTLKITKIEQLESNITSCDSYV